MTTLTDQLAPRVSRVPRSAESYRIIRPLEPDESAKQNAEAREKTFRREDFKTATAAEVYGMTALLGGTMYLAAHQGNWFFTSPLLLQVILVLVSLRITSRVFTLLVSRTRGGAYFPHGDARRYLTGTDVNLLILAVTVGIAYLALSPIAQAIAVVSTVLGLMGIHHLSVRKARKRHETAQLEDRQEVLTATS